MAIDILELYNTRGLFQISKKVTTSGFLYDIMGELSFVTREDAYELWDMSGGDVTKTFHLIRHMERVCLNELASAVKKEAASVRGTENRLKIAIHDLSVMRSKLSYYEKKEADGGMGLSALARENRWLSKQVAKDAKEKVRLKVNIDILNSRVDELESSLGERGPHYVVKSQVISLWTNGSRLESIGRVRALLKEKGYVTTPEITRLLKKEKSPNYIRDLLRDMYYSGKVGVRRINQPIKGGIQKQWFLLGEDGKPVQ